MPDDDDLADKYVVADDALRAAGLGWYEVSNWSTGERTRCEHNRLYWTGAHWWGVGPGAHSHVGGVRWWNVKHPTAYAGRIGAGDSPAYAREVLGDRDRWVERVLLEVRLGEGLDPSVLEQSGRDEVARLVEDKLVEPGGDRVVLTRTGRLLADAVVRRLLPD